MKTVRKGVRVYEVRYALPYQRRSMDGKVMIEEYIKKLKEKGFGGMLVSDHNSYDGYREWRDSIKGKNHTDFVVLKGVEYDTIDCGHMLVIMPEGVKLKLLELRGLPAQILIMVVHKYGGIVGPAHPYGEKYLSLIKTQARKKFHEERLKSLMEQFDFVEVFNACESEEVNEKARKLARKYHKPDLGEAMPTDWNVSEWRTPNCRIISAVNRI